MYDQQPSRGCCATRGGDDFTFYTRNLTEAVTNSQIQTPHVTVTRTRFLQYSDSRGISESDNVKSNRRLSDVFVFTEHGPIISVSVPKLRCH